ncbi:alpha/beta fold hydrolase [Hymenobacter weizhouensis]|uniref:alpha/beta fold hydrolase n=1 Tax=Hymenobacter sp. YIM 151500-1 TaxID=2987689 RepID=UPI002225BB38|nr:alpha/beta hydrolase [Hymenobacter sp. YIM 151500-1]UYZ62781.1 alpha/beta hydrolase [Hymenobacter sp. YIM 151500-1]
MDQPRPTILFVHGYLESSEIWNEFVQELPDTYQVLRPNLPGYGPEPGRVGDYSLEAAADFLRQQLTEAGVGRVLLVGHSMGGYVSLAFAEKYPGLVAGLCLFHSSSLPDADEDRERRTRNSAFIEEHGVAAFADEFLKPQLSAAHRESMEHHVEQLKRIAAAVPQETALGSLDAIAQRPDRRDVLEKATYPVLFIAGKDDRAVPPEKTHEESLLPDHCMVLWLARVGHLGFLERPDATRRAVEGFAELVFKQ